MKTITTYELIRQLAKLDPEGNMPVMLAVKYAKTSENGNETIDEASGFIEGFARFAVWLDGGLIINDIKHL